MRAENIITLNTYQMKRHVLVTGYESPSCQELELTEQNLVCLSGDVITEEFNETTGIDW